MINKEEILDFIKDYNELSNKIILQSHNILNKANRTSKSDLIEFLILLEQKENLLKDYQDYEKRFPDFFLDETRFINYIRETVKTN